MVKSSLDLLSDFFNEITQNSHKLASFTSILFFIVVYAILQLGVNYLTRKAEENSRKNLKKSLNFISFSFSAIATFGFYKVALKKDIPLFLFYLIIFIISLLGTIFLGLFLKNLNNKIAEMEEKIKEKQLPIFYIREVKLMKILYGFLLVFIGILLSVSGFFFNKSIICIEDKSQCKITNSYSSTYSTEGNVFEGPEGHII
jgi:amino acid transporter